MKLLNIMLINNYSPRRVDGEIFSAKDQLLA